VPQPLSISRQVSQQQILRRKNVQNRPRIGVASSRDRLSSLLRGVNRSQALEPVIEQKPRFEAIFMALQSIHRPACTVPCRFDSSGKRIGIRSALTEPAHPMRWVVEMTYLEPDADHPLGQAFDGAGRRCHCALASTNAGRYGSKNQMSILDSDDQTGLALAALR